MSSEDENYVTVTVKARGREVSVPCREAMVVTKRADGALGPALHIGDTLRLLGGGRARCVVLQPR